MKTKSKIEEKKLTKAELETREKVIKDLKKNKSSLVKRYGKDAEAVMYGRATNIAKKMAESENKNKIKELVRKALMQEMDAEAGADKYEGEQNLSQASAMLSALESKLKSHNWFHYQTDGRVYDEGMAQKKEIQDIVKNLRDMGYGDDAKELYNKYAPYEEGGVNLRLKEEDMGLEEDEDLTLTFRDKNEFERAKEHFESNSEFYPEYISDEFKSFHFKVQDQADADSTEYYLTQELEGTTDLDGYFFALEPSMMNEKKKTFPDMTGDGEVTKADILKARGVDLKEEETALKIGSTLTKNGKTGKVVKVMDDMVNVDFGNGDVYGIVKSRIKGTTISEELAEDLDVGHEDNEPHMLKADLYRIGKYAMELYQMVDEFEGKGEVDFPHWWQSKIINAKSNLVGAKHYLDFEIKEPAIDATVGSLGEVKHDTSKDTEEVKSLMKTADDTAKTPEERDEAREKAHNLRRNLKEVKNSVLSKLLGTKA